MPLFGISNLRYIRVMPFLKIMTLGHSQNTFFNFMSWNLISLTKDNFQRVRLIGAHNSLFNYDLISICETSLNDSVELPEPLLNEYTFVSANSPANKRHDGVGIFYKYCHIITWSILVKLKFGRKKRFYCLVWGHPYTSPPPPPLPPSPLLRTY